MKTRTFIAVLIAVLVVASWLFLWQQYGYHSKGISHVVPTLSEDVLPLYTEFSWGKPTISIPTIGLLSLSGVRVISLPLSGVTDIASLTTPFEMYYVKKLSDEGYKADPLLEAGGPGSALTGYRKENKFVFISYHSDFSNVPSNAPATCPCTVTFAVFTGTATGTSTEPSD